MEENNEQPKSMEQTKVNSINTRKFDKLLIFTVVILMAVTFFITYQEHHKFMDGFVTVIHVDDNEVGVLASEEKKEELEEFVRDYKSHAKDAYQVEHITFLEDITFENVHRMDVQADELTEIKERLADQLTIRTEGYAILVDGEQVAVVKDEVTSDDVLEEVALEFISDEGDLKDVDIVEDVKVKQVTINPDDIMDKETAVSILLDGEEYLETYKVEQGDSLWSIASASNKTVSELRKANPQIQEETLRPGDEVQLTQSENYISVRTAEERTSRQSISPQTEYKQDGSKWWHQSQVIEPGSSGEKEVTYKITKENGQEIDREIISREVLTDPTTRVVATGTARRPGQELGRFMFPISPSQGRFTSPYGPRGGGFHAGVDFAAPQGTPVRAADCGTVEFSGYNGSYGNLVIINHSGGYQTYYAHNSTNKVNEGDQVNKGDVIALVGTTGRSTGAHLHFEIHRGGSHVDPLNYFAP